MPNMKYLSSYRNDLQIKILILDDTTLVTYMNKSAPTLIDEGETAVEDRAAHRPEPAPATDGLHSLIGDLASQINLLALDATLAAARAGEAGWGLSIVANDLATTVKSAAEEIRNEIDATSRCSGDVVGRLLKIRKSIKLIREHLAAPTGRAHSKRSGE